MSRINRLGKFVAIVLVAGAIVTELRKPTNERTWNGELAGCIPYDFRIPRIARIEERFWNPDLDRIFTPSVFGVGWAVNVGRIARLAGLV